MLKKKLVIFLDIDECSELNSTCNGGTCNNTHGSWVCECPDGFKSVSRNETYRDCKGNLYIDSFIIPWLLKKILPNIGRMEQRISFSWMTILNRNGFYMILKQEIKNTRYS